MSGKNQQNQNQQNQNQQKQNKQNQNQNQNQNQQEQQNQNRALTARYTGQSMGEGVQGHSPHVVLRAHEAQPPSSGSVSRPSDR